MKVREHVVRGAVAREAARGPGERDGEHRLRARLGRGRTLRRRCTWPGSDVEIALAVLTQAERFEAETAAWASLKERGIDPGRPAPEHASPALAEHMVQVLARAIRDPEDDSRVFRSGEELAQVVTEDEMTVLFLAYSEHREAVDPDVTELSEQELDEFVDAAKKKGAEALSTIESSTPRRSLLSLVARLSTCLSSSSSTTPASEERPTAA